MKSCKTCSTKSRINIFDNICKECSIAVIAFNRYYESNIPIEYWLLDIEKDFHGSKTLIEQYNNIVADLPTAYGTGLAACFAGNFGLGKTFTVTSILKKACRQNYSCLYTTLSDVVSSLTLSSNEEKYLSRKELMTVDFLVIDEMDPRFIGTEHASDLFGRTLEHIFRTRSQNKLPIFFCTNSPNPVEAFSGSLKNSIESLMNRVKFVPVIGPDFRKTQTIK